jgi:hypothetical protein
LVGTDSIALLALRRKFARVLSELPLDSDSLPDNALLELVIARTRTTLPQRATLESCFGVSLADIAVYCNPATRSALERFNAEGAVYRGQILLRDTASPLFILAHEIAYILQFDATEASPSEAISSAIPLQGETDPQRYQNQLDEGSRQGREALA